MPVSSPLWSTPFWAEWEASPASPPCERRRNALAALRAVEGACRAAAAPVALGDPALARALPGGGLMRAALHEASPESGFDTAAAYGFLLGCAARALAASPGGLVWVRRRGLSEGGAPYGPGLAGVGVDPARLLLVSARAERDVLAAAEEAARTPGLAAVIAEMGGAVDLAAARRLQLAAELGGALLLVWRPPSAAAAAAARTRWRIAARPSAASGDGGGGPSPPGAPAWRAQLVRARGGRPGGFDVEWRHETGDFRVVAVLADGTAPAERRAVA